MLKQRVAVLSLLLLTNVCSSWAGKIGQALPGTNMTESKVEAENKTVESKVNEATLEVETSLGDENSTGDNHRKRPFSVADGASK